MKINTFVFNEKYSFPALIEKDSNKDLSEYILSNKFDFDSNLSKYGAILFRGFEVDTVEKFQFLSEAVNEQLVDYKLRSSPRHKLSDNVYVSTTYPKTQAINMHSESSYDPNYPLRIAFCCITPSELGGQTPIADNRIVLNNIDTKLAKKFREKGILYKRNLTGFLGMSWQESFQTSNKHDVENLCRKNNIEYKWSNEGALELAWSREAIIIHPSTREEVWFNHSMFFNKYSFDLKLLNVISSDDELPNNTFFGDGEKITKKEFDNIKEAYEKSKVEFDWQKGDVLFLDNILMSHSRNPYEGDREIVVSMS